MRLIDADELKEFFENYEACRGCSGECFNCSFNYPETFTSIIDAQPTVEIEKENKE